MLTTDHADMLTSIASPEAMMQLYEVEVTCPDMESARSIAHACLNARLIACANLLSGVESLFVWQGSIDSESEVLLRMKTPVRNFAAVCTEIQTYHPYDVPAIIALPVQGMGPGVADWAAAETAGDD